MRALVTAFCLLLGACASTPPAPRADALDPVARDYVRLVLELGEHEPGYVDAYYGPQDWADAAKAHPRPVPELKAEADRLIAAAQAVDPKSPDALQAERREYLVAHLKAARFRLDMIEGVRKPFADEAEALFGVRPELKPLSTYDPILARLETLVPSQGPLAERVDAFKSRYVIPADRLEPVMRAAIAECRKRTLAHIALPADESFTLEFVKDKSWSGYNWYKGGAKSLIQINTDLPIFIDRAVDLGCHEGYPGHHTYNALLEDRLTKGRGWIEFSVYPLYSPQSFIAEGSGNYGIDLAFPGEQRTRFEAEVLYPLAGLDPKTAGAYAELAHAMRDLAGARTTIAAMLINGEIDRPTAVALAQKYQLISKPRAEQSVSFTENYRSYVINYGLGQDMVRAHVEKAGASQDARWTAMEKLLSEPALPQDL